MITTPFEVLAYRAWLVSNGALWSTMMPHKWTRNRTIAWCGFVPAGEHDPELFERHYCGIYAAKTKALALGYACLVLNDSLAGWRTPLTVGTVLLGGMVVEGEYGYRATEARVGEIVGTVQWYNGDAYLTAPPPSLRAPIGSLSDWEGIEPEFITGKWA